MKDSPKKQLGPSEIATLMARPVLSPEEFAAVAGCSVMTIYRQVATGRLPHTRIGSLIRLPSRILADAAK